MELMTIDHNLETVQKTPCVLALGFFDGVHRGHQRVIQNAKAEADRRHLPLAVMTFDRHASAVFGHHGFFYLTTVAEKAALMAQLGVDYLYVVHFTRAFAAMAPQAFVDDVLIRLQARVVVAGFDYTFGRGGTTTIAALPRLAKHRFATIAVPELQAAAQKVSSTRIRRLIQSGQIDAAEALLGHPYRQLAQAN